VTASSGASAGGRYDGRVTRSSRIIARSTVEPIATAGEAARIVGRAAAVDAVGLEARAAALATRSIKRETKVRGLELAIRCTDLTTLEGSDTTGKIIAMCAKAVRPDPTRDDVPSVAAVCLYPQHVPVAVEQLRGTGVKVASVAGGFPAGLGSLGSRLHEIRDVVEAGADEIDIVLNRSLFLGGRYAEAFEELVAAREAAGSTHLKVILETGELGSYDRVRQASMLAMAAGADFIKTSTGKIGVSATLPVALCMLEAVRDFRTQTGRLVGVKVAGGVRRAKQALQHMVLVRETVGMEYVNPGLFRIGASSLLNDVLMQLDKERTGRYSGPDYFTLD
jgi:deoxyribose-phosphate aldolase